MWCAGVHQAMRARPISGSAVRDFVHQPKFQPEIREQLLNAPEGVAGVVFTRITTRPAWNLITRLERFLTSCILSLSDEKTESGQRVVGVVIESTPAGVVPVTYFGFGLPALREYRR